MILQSCDPVKPGSQIIISGNAVIQSFWQSAHARLIAHTACYRWPLECIVFQKISRVGGYVLHSPNCFLHPIPSKSFHFSLNSPNWTTLPSFVHFTEDKDVFSPSVCGNVTTIATWNFPKPVEHTPGPDHSNFLNYYILRKSYFCGRITMLFFQTVPGMNASGHVHSEIMIRLYFLTWKTCMLGNDCQHHNTAWHSLYVCIFKLKYLFQYKAIFHWFCHVSLGKPSKITERSYTFHENVISQHANFPNLKVQDTMSTIAGF